MAFKTLLGWQRRFSSRRWYNWLRQYVWRWLQSSILLLLAALLLSGCALNSQRFASTPTLFPTLALVIAPTATPSRSPTPAPATDTALPSDTLAPTASATITITPWIQDTVTPGPSPTGTRTPTSTRIPTRTRVPTRTPTITLTPTITFTPTPPSPVLDILSPGLLSKVLSPIQMEMYAVTGAEGKLTIELVGEDGRVISRQVEAYSEKPNRRVYIVPKMPFEIDAAAETARLQVSAQDEFGRMQSLASVDLVLLSVGRNEINPPAITQEPYIIRQPEEDGVVSGGVLVINGLARPLNLSPLIIELVNESNTVIVTKQLNVPPPTGPLSHTPFTVEIPYKVDGSTPVRLVIRQEGSRIPGTVALVSEKILLNP